MADGDEAKGMSPNFDSYTPMEFLHYTIGTLDDALGNKADKKVLFRADIPCHVARSKSTIHGKSLKNEFNMELEQKKTSFVNCSQNHFASKSTNENSRNTTFKKDLIRIHNPAVMLLDKDESIQRELNNEKKNRNKKQIWLVNNHRMGVTLQQAKQDERNQIRRKTAAANRQWRLRHWMAQVDYPRTPIYIPCVRMRYMTMKNGAKYK
uniref:Uncharacterized protein n=1 Tax=Spongospora subterranea TaxID=70186 RepID=A0A0H5RBH4_9EUKA|eukprot:CRZ10977.1 hypothetical protein [Spongospora subterranea]